MNRIAPWALVLALVQQPLAGAEPEPIRELKVCADPNNLPFSNRAGEGLENRLVALLAEELGATVDYTWFAQRRGFLRNTLLAGRCDVVPGIASTMPMLATTRPYYRSSYMFLTRAAAGLDIASLDDSRLHELTIGVQMIGDDASNTPPAHALARRGIIANVRGFSVFGDYRSPHPQAAVVEAVARGEIDVALAWGPVAGWFAAQQRVPLRAAPVTPWLDGPQWPMVFDISLGVRREDRALRRALDRALAARRDQVEAVLDAYHVPRVPRN
jgi:mxaJ protein